MNYIRLFFPESLSVNFNSKLEKSQSHYLTKVVRLNLGENFFDNFKPSLNLSPKCDLYEAAHNLFDYLRKLDKLTKKRIVVVPIPKKGIGKTINERLARAAIK